MYHKDAFFEIDFSVAGESPDCHSPPPPSPLQPPPLSPPPSSPASPPPAPPYSCNCWGDPHCSTFSNDGHDFYGVGLYEYARFCTSGPCGTCEVDIQTFLGRPLHSSQPNSFIVGIAVRMCGWTLEFDEDAVKVYYDATATIWGVYHLGSGHIGTLSTFPPCIGASMENSASLERVQNDLAIQDGRSFTVNGWRLHLPNGAGNFLVNVVGYSSLARGYYYNTWLNVASSVIDHPPTDCPARANSGLCFDRCPDVVPGIVAPGPFQCGLSPLSPPQCYPVLATDQAFSAVSSTLAYLEAGYTGSQSSTRRCRRRLQQVETIEQTTPAASDISYTDACNAVDIDPAIAMESCNSGCGTTMDEQCAYDYCATEGDSSFFEAYKGICAIHKNQMPPPSPVVDVFIDPNCAGKRRRITTADFLGGRHDNGWDACYGLWDDGSEMTYQPARRTWWGSFKVVAGYAVNTYSACHDDFYYASMAPREVGFTSAAGCVSPTYPFTYVSMWHSLPAQSFDVTITANGDPSSFDSSAYNTGLRLYLSCFAPDCEMESTVSSPGSVIVQSTVTDATGSANAAANRMTTSTLEELSTALGVIVEATPVVSAPINTTLTIPALPLAPPPPSPNLPPSPSPPVPYLPPPPPSPLSPCEKLQQCTDECSSDQVVCKSGCADKKKCKKRCKKDRNKCKNSCESTYKCPNPPSPPPSCDDNTIPGFGSWWCEMNAPDPSFCKNEAQMNKCKKTCGLCG